MAFSLLTSGFSQSWPLGHPSLVLRVYVCDCIQ